MKNKTINYLLAVKLFIFLGLFALTVTIAFQKYHPSFKAAHLSMSIIMLIILFIQFCSIFIGNSSKVGKYIELGAIFLLLLVSSIITIILNATNVINVPPEFASTLRIYKLCYMISTALLLIYFIILSFTLGQNNNNQDQEEALGQNNNNQDQEEEEEE